MKIEIKNIKKNYSKKEVLRDVSFEASSGECIGILGENGSGKSTLFSVLTGLQKGEGAFLADGADLMKSPSKRERIVGFVPQSPPLMAELSAKDNLRLWYKKAEMEKELSGGVLSLLGISEFVKVPVSKMSGGMKKRLSIGCAVANHPTVLFLDEPSAALDIVCKEKIGDYLRKFKKAGGIIVIATHDVYELDLCDKLYILKDGALTLYEGERDVKSLAKQLS